ncbi:hypothetical protein [Citricoccus alkalitolerans]|uniref:Uncharacterized protein n=1 Tax=Citricoccus alkalitolerans TaxID=246603 RepID=A0ABV8Y2V8_9MICC
MTITANPAPVDLNAMVSALIDGRGECLTGFDVEAIVSMAFFADCLR